MTNIYARVPTPATGLELSPNDGNWAVIFPEETTNLITNPSFELSLDGWTTPLSTIVARRSNFRSFRGAYSAVVASSPPNYTDPSNDHYIETSLTGWIAGQPLTVSADGWSNFLGTANKENRIGVLIDAVETLSEPLSSVEIWERLSLTILIPSGTTTVEIRLYMGKAMANPTDVINTTYWDGVQAENLGYATTYTDGDQHGLAGEIVPYRWLGLPHASKSKRSKATKSGGRIVNFNEVGFRISGYTGAGFTGFDDISLEYALTEGELYQRTIGKARTITLTGFVCGSDSKDLQCKIHDMQNLLSPNIATQNGQLLLRYTNCECPGALDLLVSYLAGAEGNYTNHWQQNYGLRFKAHQPFFTKDGENGAALSFLQGISGNLRIIQQNENGEWARVEDATFQAGFTDEINAIGFIGSDVFFALDGFWQKDIDDNLTQWQLPGVNNIDNFIPLRSGNFITSRARYGTSPTSDLSLFYLVDGILSNSQIGEWTNDQEGIYTTIAEDNNNDIFIGGDRGDIRRWDGTIGGCVPAGNCDTDATWPQIVTDFIGQIKQIAFDSENTMFVVGLFSTPFGSTTTTTTEKPVTLQAKPTATPETIGIFTFDGVLVAQSPGNPPTLDFCARVDRIPDGRSITTYTWWAEYDTLTTYTGECVQFTLTEPGGWTSPTVKIYLELTLDDGTTAQKEYHYRPETDPDTGEIEYSSISGLDTGQILETLTLDLVPDYCIATIENDQCEGDTTTNSNGTDEDDPVASWLWSNSIDAQTSTDEEAQFVLNPALGDTFTITLTVITDSGESNTNTITYEYLNSELITISQTDIITSYILTYTDTNFRPFQNAVFLKDGQWQDFGELVEDTSAVEFDGQSVFIGGTYGVKKFDGGSLTNIGDISQIRALKFKDGILYAVNNANVWRFNGSLWQPLGLSYPNNASLIDIDISDANEIVVASNTPNGTMTTSAITEIPYNGTVESRPKIEAVGPGRLWYITNHTTDRTIYIDYLMAENERVTIELQQGNVSIGSNLYGALSFLPGSRADWYMAEGLNDVELWVTGGNADTKTTLIRRLKHHSVDGLCCDLDDQDTNRYEYVSDVLCCDSDPALAIKKVSNPSVPSCDSSYNAGSLWFDSSTGRWYIRAVVS